MHMAADLSQSEANKGRSSCTTMELETSQMNPGIDSRAQASLGNPAHAVDCQSVFQGSSSGPHRDIVLQQPVGDLGEVGGLADAVDAHKHDGVWLAARLCERNVAQDVDGAPRREDAVQRRFHGRAHGR